LIYKSFNILPLQEQLRLTELLLEKYFNSLFYSWSWNIRTVFFKLYLYQLFRVYEGEPIGHEATAEFKDKTQPNIKRRGSSDNISFNKYHELNKSMTISRTTIGMDIKQRYLYTLLQKTFICKLSQTVYSLFYILDIVYRILLSIIYML